MSASTDREDAREAMRKIIKANGPTEINEFLAELRKDSTKTIRVLTAALRASYGGKNKLSEWPLLFNHIKTTFPELAEEYLIGLSVD